MNLVMKHTPEKELTVTVEYPAMDKTVKRLVGKIKSCDLSICCQGDGTISSIRLDDVFYIESVDRRTFVYTSKDIFRCEQKLYEIEAEFEGLNLVRINKSCLINIDKLHSVKQLMNSRLAFRNVKVSAGISGYLLE